MEELVVYHALYDSKDFGKNALWAKPKPMFLEHVKDIDGKKISRFKHVGQSGFLSK